jgi:hypothetical protein
MKGIFLKQFQKFVSIIGKILRKHSQQFGLDENFIQSI